ncbi:MAG TPA: hypothetical protein VKT27_05225 [Candidatus Binataceae bacterium]|nr:hypothetical protein [Candidatus Binataceae bacterium]
MIDLGGLVIISGFKFFFLVAACLETSVGTSGSRDLVARASRVQRFAGRAGLMLAIFQNVGIDCFRM